MNSILNALELLDKIYCNWKYEQYADVPEPHYECIECGHEHYSQQDADDCCCCC